MADDGIDTAAIQQQAATQIAAENAPQLAELGSRIDTLGKREDQAIGQVGQMYGQLQPFVAGEADKVQGDYGNAFQAEQSIFNTAMARMSALKQSRAQEAQTLAQEMGGPVAVGEFTASVLPSQEQLSLVAPNSLLHSLADAQSGTQEARAWSGRVFPLIRTEQEAKTRGLFEDQIKSEQDKIDAIGATTPAAVNSRYTELLTQERNYNLEKQKVALDTVKANRDWRATLHSLSNDDARLKLADKQWKQQLKLQQAGVTGVYGGKPTLASLKLTAAEKQATATLKLSAEKSQETLRHHLESEAVATQKLRNQQQTNAMKIVDTALNPSKAQSLKLQSKVALSKDQVPFAMAGKIKNAYRDSKGNWYQYVTKTLTPSQAIAQGYTLPGGTPIADPNDLYNLLVGSGTNPTMARNVVAMKTGIKDFQPGHEVNYTPESLGHMTNKELMGIAKQRGWSGRGGRGDLVQFILARNLNTDTPTTPRYP